MFDVEILSEEEVDAQVRVRCDGRLERVRTSRERKEWPIAFKLQVYRSVCEYVLQFRVVDQQVVQHQNGVVERGEV